MHRPILSGALLWMISAVLEAAPMVKVERVPEGGLQPVARVDAAGRIHLVYLTGEPKTADVRYVTRVPGGDWSIPVTVNSQAGSAIAVGTVRGPRLALGPGGHPHVIWNGSGQAEPKGEGGVPLLYSRWDAEAGRFEPQRALGGGTRHLDGGAAVVAASDGSVEVVWHAAPPTPPPGGDGEVHRGVYSRRSGDGGRTFSAPRRVDPPGVGVCACCGLAAGAGPTGATWILYRGADAGTERGFRMITSGSPQDTRVLDHWNLSQCPMTTAQFEVGGLGTRAVWSTRGVIQLADLPLGSPRSVSGEGHAANHPALARNRAGDSVVAWTEGTGWQRGGRLAYGVLDAGLRPIGEVRREEGVPVWGAVAVWPEGDDFVVAY